MFLGLLILVEAANAWTVSHLAETSTLRMYAPEHPLVRVSRTKEGGVM